MSSAVAILAGGRSSRMGQDKSFILLDGKPMIEHVLNRVQSLDIPVILIVNQQECYRSLNLPMFSDVLPEKGSLGGLYTALSYSPADNILCVACDMPFLNVRLLRHLLISFGDCDALVPRIKGRAEGLHAVYNKQCLAVMETCIKDERLKIGKFLDSTDTRYLEEVDVRRFDPELRSFVNINTADDLKRYT